MNKRAIHYWIIFIASIISLVGAIVWVQHSRDGGDKSYDASELTRRGEVASLPSHVSSTLTAIKTMPPSGHAEFDRRTEKMRTVMLALNKSLAFYGAVEDQNGDRVSGVRIEAHVKYHDGLVRPDYTSAFQQISVRTDQSGEFSVTGQQGEGLFIDRLEMDGYVVAQLGPQTFDALYHVPGNTQWPIQLSKDSPAILRIWKKGEPAALIERGTTVLTAADEHVKRFQLEGVPIEMELQWSRTGTWTDPQAWSITLKVIDGGIMENTDAFSYEAPASGYQAQWTENRVRGTPEWTPNFRKRFYLTAANGKYYGHALINFDPFFRERTHLGLSYSINPNGSRNLLSASER